VAVEGLSIRLYLDHNAHERFAVDVRRAGFEVVLSRDVGNAMASDPIQLEWAKATGCCLLTHDFDDFPELARRWAAEGRDHAGIILSLQPGGKTTCGTLLRRLLRVAGQDLG
jgi:predicted nuclease of predicted toxin-antitoxin system